MGCLLYCATTQELTRGIRRASRNPDWARYFPRDESDEDAITFWNPDPKGEGDLESFLYVDDTTLFDLDPMEEAVRHVSGGTTTEKFMGLQLGRDFETVSGRARGMGMRINGKKTQLLVISPSNGCDTSAEFVTSEGLEVWTHSSWKTQSHYLNSMQEQRRKKKTFITLVLAFNLH